MLQLSLNNQGQTWLAYEKYELGSSLYKRAKLDLELKKKNQTRLNPPQKKRGKKKKRSITTAENLNLLVSFSNDKGKVV